MIVALILLAILLFYSLQKYVVTTSDGISLELPFLQGDESEAEGSGSPPSELPSAELVIEEPNYEDIQTDAGEDLTELRALLVPQEDISDSGLATAAQSAQALGATALVLEMKPESGLLSWNSYSETAVSYGTAGTESIGETLSALAQDGMYLAAQISVCIDDLMASRNPTAALRTADGETYTDEYGGRLDPYNSFVRTYILELINELEAMGFDEIILTNLSMPSGEYQYSQEMTYTADAQAALVSFSNWLTTNCSGFDISISAVFDGSGAGQSEESFFMLYDRLCYPCSSDQIETLRAGAQAAMGSGSADVRFVPITTQAPESGSWIIQS